MAGLADELERFEKEIAGIGNEDVDGETEIEGSQAEPEPEVEAASESAADEGVSPAPEPESQQEPEPETASKAARNLTTLPDDEAAFGKLAGQQVTAEQIIEAGLLDKLVMWGHQGRHLVQKGQKELDEARAEKSEAQKLRELLEERFKREDQVAAKQSAPVVKEDQFAEQLVNAYIPGMKQIAAQGGIEEDFVKEFPKVAAHIEHRFQNGAQLLQGVVQALDEVMNFVGMQKEEQTRQSKKGYFEGVLDQVSSEGDLFNGLTDKQARVDFIKWVSADDSGLKMATKDVEQITAADVQSAWLLYLHKHPGAMKPAATQKARSENAHLAGGGGGKAPSKKTRRDTEELDAFEREMREMEGRGEIY